MERRLQPRPGQVAALSKPAPLPFDYLKMVNEVFATHFAGALKLLKKNGKKNRFSASGFIFPDEILLSISFIEEGLLSATTVHASCDFDPSATRPTAEELLSSCVDAVASLLSDLLPEKNPEQVLEFMEKPLSAFENVPFDWNPMVVNQRQVYLKMDKSNPDLEKMTEEWLDKHDPDRADRDAEEQESDEDLLAERLAAKGPGKKSPTRH